MTRVSVRALCGLPVLMAFGIGVPGAIAPTYWLYVTSEAADTISVVRFDPPALRVERSVSTQVVPGEIAGPHAVALSPDGRFYYVSIAHGRPFGIVSKYRVEGDGIVGRAGAGMFPASLRPTPDGRMLFVANFNLHGDPVRSSVSVIETGEMFEMTRIPTCRMPHGSRFSSDGRRHYSVCMMDDLVAEIDATRLELIRTLDVAPAENGSGAASARSTPHPSNAAGDHTSSSRCGPTWVQPSPDGASLYVACNASDEIVEITVSSGNVLRRLPARRGVYTLALTDDRKLLATNKRDHSLSVIDLQTGKELTRLATRRPVPHGVVVSSDGRYAFVTAEGINPEPGSLEAIELTSLATVAAIDLPSQAAGIDILTPLK